MRKFLKSKDILLLGLANLLDATEEIRDPFRLVSTSYKSMYGWIPTEYRKHNFYQLVSRSLKTQLIEKVEKGGEVYIRITSKGRKTIQRDFPILSLQKRQWDRKWRIVMFDIEEINKQVRERLRIKLKELGFGMLQKSVFISPYDMLKDFSEFAQASGIKNYLYLLETSKLVVNDERELANKVWKLEELNERYKDLVDEIGKIKNSYMITNSDRIKKSDSKIEEKVRKKMRNIKANIRNSWLKIIIVDPFLPKTLLPKPWWGEEAARLIKNLVI